MNERPQMELAGDDGNIFSILGRASRLLKQNGQTEEAKEMFDCVTACHSYDEALCIISEYVETELSPATQLRTSSQTKHKEKKSHHER